MKSEVGSVAGFVEDVAIDMDGDTEVRSRGDGGGEVPDDAKEWLESGLRWKGLVDVELEMGVMSVENV